MLIDLKQQPPAYRRITHAAAFMSNWGLLHAHLAEQDKAGKLTLFHVEHLLRVELATRKRLVVATRLLGVYHRLAREENERRLAEALGAK